MMPTFQVKELLTSFVVLTYKNRKKKNKSISVALSWHRKDI